ncbi:MAG: hypothetical protein ABSE59_02655 [Opitutaceae bacterium]
MDKNTHVISQLVGDSGLVPACAQLAWHGHTRDGLIAMINWVITFLLLAVVCSVVGFFGTEPAFVGQSACVLAGGFFIFALIVLFLNHKHPRIH